MDVKGDNSPVGDADARRENTARMMKDTRRGAREPLDFKKRLSYLSDISGCCRKSRQLRTHPSNLTRIMPA
jgi:hypothetical protein